MSLEYLIPFSKTNAIQSVIFALEWQGDLSDSVLSKIQDLASSLKNDFPEALIQKTVRINLGNIGTEPIKPSPENNPDGGLLGGMTFIRKGKFGTAVSKLNVNRTNCVIEINEYDRWEPTIRAVMNYFKIVLPVILTDKSVSVVALQYTDSFAWKDDPENLNLSEVFSDNSPYLTSNVFKQKNLWHCHHGYWIEGLGGLGGNCLDNINISTVENKGDREIQIVTAHQFVLDKHIRLSTENYLGTIETIQNKLHVHNKNILTQLLSQKVCKKIGLTCDKEGV